MSELNEMSGKTLDIEKQNIEKLKELFPEIVTEDKIDFEKFRAIFGDEIETSSEKYSFTWNGKNESIKLAQQPSTGTLRPNKEKSKKWEDTENLYIEGDNLEVLKLLQKSYAGKIKVIYIDPPYNTGNDFVYKDDYKDNIQNYFEQTGQVDSEGSKLSTNTESSGRFHTDWLNMMYPRLVLAKNLLTDDGAIFISIDDNEYSNLKKICDEIFGENKFIGTFLWNKSQNPPSLSHTIRRKFEYILCYKKNRLDQKLFGGVMSGGDSPLYNGGNPTSILKFPSETVKFNIPDGIYNDSKDSLIKLMKPVEIKNSVNTNELVLQGQFRWSQNTLLEEIAKDTKIIVKSDKFSPRYVRQGDRTMVPSDLLSMKENQINTNEKGRKEIEDLFEKNLFPFPKPTSLIEYLINTLTYNSRDDIILDFFSGSGTTAHATMELNAEDNGNRKFIMVQLPEPLNEKDVAYKDGYKNISEISQERIRRAGEKIIEDNQLFEGELDTGFKVFELDNSNIQRWNMNSENIEESLFAIENNFVEGRSHADIVYEVLLKLGLDLNTPFEETIVDESTVYDVALGNVYVVLGENITQEAANYIADKQKDYENENPSVVFNDNGFVNDNEKLNTIEILKNNGFNEEQLMSI